MQRRLDGRETLAAVDTLFHGREFISLRPNEKWMLVELLGLANRTPNQPVEVSLHPLSRTTPGYCTYVRKERPGAHSKSYARAVL